MLTTCSSGNEAQKKGCTWHHWYLLQQTTFGKLKHPFMTCGFQPWKLHSEHVLKFTPRASPIEHGKTALPCSSVDVVVIFRCMNLLQGSARRWHLGSLWRWGSLAKPSPKLLTERFPNGHLVTVRYIFVSKRPRVDRRTGRVPLFFSRRDMNRTYIRED